MCLSPIPMQKHVNSKHKQAKAGFQGARTKEALTQQSLA